MKRDQLAHLDDDQPRRGVAAWPRRIQSIEPARIECRAVRARLPRAIAGGDRILASRSVGQIADHLPSGAPPSLPSESSPAVPRVPSIARKARRALLVMGPVHARTTPTRASARREDISREFP